MPLQNKAMEYNSTHEQEIKALTNQTEELIKQRDEVYEDSSQSGEMFMMLCKELIAKKPLTNSESQAFHQLCYCNKWKAVPITRKLLIIGKRIKRLQGEAFTPSRNIEEVQVFEQLKEDNYSFISKLPSAIINKIKADIIEADEALITTIRIFHQQIIGKYIQNYMVEPKK